MSAALLGVLAGATWVYLTSAPIRRFKAARERSHRVALPLPAFVDQPVPVLPRGSGRAQSIDELLNAYERVIGERLWIRTMALNEPVDERRAKLEGLRAETAERAHRFRTAVLDGIREVEPEPQPAASADELADRAWALIHAGEYAAALEMIEPHEDQLANLRLSKAYVVGLRWKREFARAVDHLARQLESTSLTGPDRVEVARARASIICQGQVGTREDAIAAADHAVELAPDDAQAQYLRGLTDLKFGRVTSEGLAAARRAVVLKPDDLDYLRTAMSLARSVGDVSGARSYASQLLALKPSPASVGAVVAHVVLSDSLSRRTRMFKAARHLRQALRGEQGPVMKGPRVGYAIRWIGVINSSCFASALWVALLAFDPAFRFPRMAVALLPMVNVLVGVVTISYAVGVRSVAEVGRTIRRETPPLPRVSGILAIVSVTALALCATPFVGAPLVAGLSASVIVVEVFWAASLRNRKPPAKVTHRKHRAA